MGRWGKVAIVAVDVAWRADERRARAKEYTTTYWSDDKGNEPDRGEGQ